MEEPTNNVTDDPCIHGCISEYKVDQFKIFLDSFITKPQHDIFNTIKDQITTLVSKETIKRREKSLYKFPNTDFKDNLIKNLKELQKEINDHNEKLKTSSSNHVFTRDLGVIENFIYEVNKKPRLLSKDKYSAIQQLEAFRRFFEDLNTEDANETQKRELGAFYIKDNHIRERYNFELINNEFADNEIKITEKTNSDTDNTQNTDTTQNIYYMKADGGIVKKDENGQEHFYVWSFNDKVGNIYFRQAEYIKDSFGSRLLQNIQGWWGGKTKKRRKNAKKRRKTRRN